MKLLVNLVRLLTIFSLVFVSCNISDNGTNNSSIKYLNKKINNVTYTNVPDSIKILYKEFAGTLALREIQSDAKLRETLVKIPDEYIQLFYNALIQVYNSANIPARNIVINDYSISVFFAPESHYLLVDVDTTFNWVKQWMKDSLNSGNLKVDSLTTNYGLSIYRSYNWAWSYNFLLKAAQPINIIALCQLFKGVEGVKQVYPDGVTGDGNNIIAAITDEYVTLDYSYGFGDCPAGCISRHYWHFLVYYDGIVEYIGESGDPI
ncbi:MAG: hypothetical protein V1773_01575 [bacterium]